MFSFLKKIIEKNLNLITKIKEVISPILKRFLSILKKISVRKKNKIENHDQILVANLAKSRLPKFAQIKYIGRVLKQEEFKRAKIAIYFLSLGFLGIIATGFFLFTKTAPASGGSYTEGLVGSPKFINPIYSSLSEVDSDLTTLIYSGLIKIDKDHNLVPDLAENWTVSENQKEYIFTLKKDLKWHDGEPITADDVAFTIETIQNPDFKSPIAINFTNVVVETIDDRNIKFTLSNSFNPFLENLTVGILPAHIWRDISPANILLADYNIKPIGSGPFKFKSFIKDRIGNIKAYTIEKNNNYLPRAPYLKEITFKFYLDFESAISALKNHSVEGISFLPIGTDGFDIEKHDLDFKKMSLSQYTAIFLNQSKNTALKDIKVRQALYYAIDKNEIIKQALNGNGETIDSPILPGSIGYSKEIPKYGYDVGAANRLLDEAGFKYEITKDGDTEIKSQWRKKNKEDLTIILTTVNRSENYKAVIAIQKFWRDIGVNAELKIVEQSSIQKDVVPSRNFQALLFGEILGIDPDPYPFWHSSAANENGLNLSNFSNKEADRILEEARQIIDVKERYDKYIKFQNILISEVPAIFLYSQKYIYPISDKIKDFGVEKISLPSNRFANVINWYIKTRRVIK
jgi:peptide/nickel transport system substrate-binding protein